MIATDGLGRAAWRFMLASLIIHAHASGAEPVLSPPTDLRFEVHLNPPRARSTDQIPSGRLLVVLGSTEQGEPRLSVGHPGMDAAPILGRDLEACPMDTRVIVDRQAAIFPLERLEQLRPGRYKAQAILHTNPDVNVMNAPGDLYGSVKIVDLDPAKGGTVALELDNRVADEHLPADTELVKHIKLPSKLLSEFHGRPISLRAGIILPRDFTTQPDARYPLRVHIGGYGSRFHGVDRLMAKGSAFQQNWLADGTPRMILLHLDGAGPLGDPYQVDSANHGPYGAAVTEELIPWVEKHYRGIGHGKARVLDGGSTGGWVALALQVFYPDFFNGAWAFCPDGVDFRGFQLVNIYRDENAYVNEHHFERPGARDVSGDVRYTMRHECQLENVLGRGDSWARSGGQWGAWNATYGPRGVDGQPVPLWNPRTGVIDRGVLEHWKAYDLRLRLEKNWVTLAPKLEGKLHIWVGEADDYFLNNAVHQLDDFLSTARPPYKGSITFGPGKGHCWLGITEREMMTQMGKRVSMTGLPASRD